MEANEGPIEKPNTRVLNPPKKQRAYEDHQERFIKNSSEPFCAGDPAGDWREGVLSRRLKSKSKSPSRTIAGKNTTQSKKKV